MKKHTLKNLIISLVIPMSVVVGMSFSNNASLVSADNLSNYASNDRYLPTTIYLRDNTEDEIRDYYKDLLSLPENERKGQNLLKNLKPILARNQKYYNYDDSKAVWKYYEITDRDWDLSPAESTTYGTYDAETETITKYVYGSSYSTTKNNPYLHLLYRNVGEASGYTRAWDVHGGEKTNGIDREHVWPKSHGFNEELTGARGDPHHLMAGDHIINNNHNDLTYGYVADKTSISKLSYLEGNYKGASEKYGGTVFEPQDSDKGDIARAVFYMAARYNNISNTDNTIDSGNPNLTVVNGIVNETGSSTSSTPFAIGNLEDLIDWAKNVDDVDYYEYHRNNLIYNNYGMNRNPFIDFPEWIDSVWGNGDAADPEHDAVSIPTKVSVPHEPINTTEEEPPEELVQDENNTDLKSSILGFDNGDRVTNFAIDDFTEITFAKNEGATYPAYYETGLSLRAYGGNTITFSSTRKIVRLVLFFGSGDGENTITSDDSLFSETFWNNPEGDKEIVLNIEGSTGHRRISRIHLTYEELVPTERILSQDRSVYAFGEGNGRVNAELIVTQKYENGPDQILELETPVTVTLNTLQLGTTSKEVNYGNNDYVFDFKVTNENYIYSTSTLVDNLTQSSFASTAANKYVPFDNIEDKSGIKYSGLTAGGYGSIQINKNETYGYGFYTAESDANIYKVRVEWNEKTVETDRTLYFYGKNTPYTSLFDVYDTSLKGTEIAKIPCHNTNDYIINGNYRYIAVMCEGGAVYLNSVNITYKKVIDEHTQAESFAKYFLDLTSPICSLNNGTSSNKNALTNIWSNFVSEFSFMPNEAKEEFKNNSNNESILNAKEKLGYILSKYDLENFASIKVSKINSHSYNLFNNSENNDHINNEASAIVLISLGLVATTLFVCYTKRRKEN